MEHIVQFAIGIDDEAIRKRVEENAYDDILNKLMTEAKRDLPSSRGTHFSNGVKIHWRYLMEERIDVFCEKHKDEIIDAAAEKLCEKFSRTKAFKEKMAEAMEE